MSEADMQDTGDTLDGPGEDDGDNDDGIGGGGVMRKKIMTIVMIDHWPLIFFML